MNGFPQDFYQWLVWLVSGFGLYLFYQVNLHEKRIQKLEQLGDAKMDALSKKVDTLELRLEGLEKRMTEMEKTLVEIKTNIHSQKNQESYLNATLTAILRHLEKAEV